MYVTPHRHQKLTSKVDQTVEMTHTPDCTCWSEYDTQV